MDFQNFVMTNRQNWTKEILKDAASSLKFGNSRAWRNQEYLYQSVPGLLSSAKRNTNKRWSNCEEKLQQLGIKFQHRVVIDIGCNSGMFLLQALERGAIWGYGFDKPEVVKYSNLLLKSLGTPRFTLVGEDLNEKTSLTTKIANHHKSLLDKSIIFYLAIRHHVGLINVNVA